MDLVGGRRILDQLEHPVAKHHRPRCGRQVLANAKGILVGQRYQQITLVVFQIADQIFQPRHQRLAVGFHGAGQRLGVGAKEIGRRKHVDDLAAEIFDALLVLAVQMLQRRHGAFHRLGRQQILLFDIVEIGMGIPQRVGKPAVFRGGINRGHQLAAAQGLLRLDEMFQRLAPVADLMFQNFRRVLQHVHHIGRRRFHEHIVARPGQSRVMRLFLCNCSNQPLRQRLYFCQIGIHPLQIFCRVMIFCCHVNVSTLHSAMQHCVASPGESDGNSGSFLEARRYEVYANLRHDGNGPQHQRMVGGNGAGDGILSGNRSDADTDVQDDGRLGRSDRADVRPHGGETRLGHPYSAG